ncbi:multicomponent Na+:H+ antiporter subunit G [Cytobacillus eiseniae]|uniref:Multicomponent Na+:H+ antiporter subunit G n=1 Tax=Cytobacillus eiseniae TaxID=762947 RepID=A0ABS4RDN8_9BACI|nr:monovalent cation/H(+) antiporter subunit G [Cytobacillus eiseniae]MBP2241012.1 multicomponent Na+:H+ antiporter subunit G [Cytobacillus eiseniae]
MSISTQSEILVGLLIFIGTAFSFLSAIGIIRLPDVYTRAHAASKSTSLGVLFILFGTFLYFVITDGYISIRLILGIFFVFLTSPVVAHLLNRAAYRSKVELAEVSIKDDLKEYLKEKDA